MTEDDARREVGRRIGDTVVHLLARLVDMVIAENAIQNLIAPSTVSEIWSRHVLDSVQLLALASARKGVWVDIGTGGGFPGMVIAAAWAGPVLLVEPRRRRAEFLQTSAQQLGLNKVAVIQSRIEHSAQPATIISARAVASVENLLLSARVCATAETRWLLPRGSLDPASLAALRSRGAVFHVEQSITSDHSSILVIDGLGS